MIFRYPVFQPQYQEGLQVHNPGPGGPSGNPALMASHPQSWPAMTGHLSGLFIMPNYLQAWPQMPVNNQIANPGTYTVMPGLIKSPSYGG